MMELAERMAQPCVLADLAAKVTYNDRLTDEEQEMSAVLDESIRKIGETGHDPNHELAALVKKTFTPETVSAPSAFMEEAFDEGTIGEFDDYFTEVEPKNTIQVHEATMGGNVDASYIEHKIMKPTWKSLQAEVYIPMRDIRRGGYKTVANYTERINQALEDQKICDIIKALDAAITSTHPGYIAEATGAPTATSADQLALYLQEAVSRRHGTLMRPVNLVPQRYNLHLTRGSLIMEVGSSGNTLQEALAAIRLFADAAAPALLELVE